MTRLTRLLISGSNLKTLRCKQPYNFLVRRRAARLGISQQCWNITGVRLPSVRVSNSGGVAA